MPEYKDFKYNQFFLKGEKGELGMTGAKGEKVSWFLTSVLMCSLEVDAMYWLWMKSCKIYWGSRKNIWVWEKFSVSKCALYFIQAPSWEGIYIGK